MNRCPTKSTTGRAPRAGFTLFELIVTALLLGTVTLTLTPLMHAIVTQRRAAETRQLAQLEVANTMERLSQRSWETLENDLLADWPLTDACAETLAEPRLAITVVETDDDIPAKRVTVTLDWVDRGRNRVTPVRLTAWLPRETHP